MNKKEVSKYMSKISKMGHKKSPRPKEHFQKMNKKSQQSRSKKISTDPADLHLDVQ